MTDYGLDLAVIGNGRTAALVDPTIAHRVVVPAALRQRSGVLPPDRRQRGKGLHRRCARRLRSRRARNICATPRSSSPNSSTSNGGAVRITDFAPRFEEYGRTFRPPQLIRIVEPIAGTAAHHASASAPTHRYGEPVTTRTSGSNHIRYLARRRRRCGSPPTRRSPISRAKRRSC